MDVRSRSQQRSHDRGGFDAIESIRRRFHDRARGRVVQSRVVHVGSSVHIRAGFQQHGHDGGGVPRGDPGGSAPPAQGEKEWSVLGFVARVHIRPGRQTGGGHLGGGDAGETLRVPVAAVHGIGDLARVVDQDGVGSEFQEEEGHGGVSVAPGSMQGRVPVPVAGVQIGTALHQFRHHGRVTIPSGSHVQGCHAFDVPSIHPRAGRQKHRDHAVP